MGNPKQPKLVKLIVGMISSSEDLFSLAKERLKKEFGRIDFISQTMAFEVTDYYKEEMGQDLKRQFVSFEELISPIKLPEIKIFTNSAEQDFSLNNKRRINLDPGYISASKLILATTKDYQHRVYLQDGIYAEVTLRFKAGGFQTWEWTYPDYRTGEYIKIFNQIRQLYMKQGNYSGR